jgi:ATP synthase protein I
VKAPQSERQLRFRRAGTAYQGAIESVFAILIGVGLGYGADAVFGTSPWGVLVGLALGFGAFVLRLIRLARQLQGLDDGDDAGSGRE